MARFDLYRNPDGAGYLIECQADLLSDLNTRVVIPLMRRVPSRNLPAASTCGST